MDNGIYCTGKSLQEINQELLQSCFCDGITVYDGQGNAYLIAAEDIGYTFDFEEALDAALFSFESQICLAQSGCYEDLPYSDEMKRELEKWEQIKEFQECHIVYRFGEEEVSGEIYKTRGSYGCINTPYEAMSKLYDTVEVGTSVVRFY